MNPHVLLLVAEAALVGSIVLSLFGLRRRLGLGPVYLVVGAFQYLQIVLATSVRIEFAPGVVVDPASVVLFPIVTVVVLLTYIELDAEETRKVAYGVVISNLAAYAVAAVAGWHLVVDGAGNPLGLPVTLFTQSLRLALASTLALFVDVVAALVVFEAISRRLRPLFLRLWLTVTLIMALDSVLFSVGVFLGRPGFAGALVYGFLAKFAGASFYAAFVALYVRYVDPDAPGADGPSSRDVFTWLTYRQRYEAARIQLTRDALTGLYNRGYFDEHAPRQVAHAERAGHAMSLVLIDVDRLKATNDRHGHQAGDELLRFVGRQIAAMVRASDAACRYGGDEFVVVLTNADRPAARIFAERLLDNITARSREVSPPPPWAPATISVGIAVFPHDGADVTALIARADERLYEGKRRGGGAVVAGGRQG
ncbi:MAG: diguanylate cyclase [Vicinamibacterales bacterium]